MGGKSPSLPAAPDPAQTSAAQSASNQGTARVNAALNRVNTVNPYESVTWTKGAGAGGYEQPKSYPGQGGPPPPPAAGAPPPPSTGSPPPPDSGTATASSSGSSSGSSTVAYYDSQGFPHAADGSPVYGVANGDPGSTPGGTVTGSSDPGSTSNADTANPDVTGDQYTQVTTLSPEQQKIYDAQTQLQTGVLGLGNSLVPKIGNALNTTVTYDGLPANVTGVDYSKLQTVDPNFSRGQIQTSVPGMGDLTSSVSATPIQTSLADIGGPDRTLNVSDPTALMQQAASTLYGAQSALFQPQIQQQREELRQSLADRGIPEDSDAGLRELKNFDNSANITAQQAAASAVTGAQNLAPTLFGMDLSKFNAENAAQGQQFTQGLQSGEFGNEAQQLVFGQGVTNANLNNSAQQQDFTANLQQGQFANEAQNQDFTQQLQQQQLAEALRAQGLSEQEINAQLAAQARSAGYQEQQNVRSQPINDLATLLRASGGAGG